MLNALTYPGNLRLALVRRALRDSRRASLERLVRISALSRPAYGYGMLHAARLARRLGIGTISAIEFGVAGGNGLRYMEYLAEMIERQIGVRYEIFGFDNVEGLPAPSDLRDLPYWFQRGFYEMDVDRLRQSLKQSSLVLGNVKDTVGTFVETHSPPPIGFISNDLDFYSSTIDSFRIFDNEPEQFLPRAFLYFDDIVGTELEMYGPDSGELLAVREFNDTRPDQTIRLNQNLVPRTVHPWQSWHHQIYYYHDFRHPGYGTYVGGEEQDSMREVLVLSEPK